MSDVGRMVASALAGAVVAWTGHTLTFMGRLDAVEKTLLRIETRLDGRPVK